MFGQIINLPQASTMAGSIDALYDFIFWLSVVSLIAVTVAIIYFMIRYRRRSDDDKTPYIEGHAPSEMSVAVILFVIVMVIFYWGWIDYKKILTAPADAMEINIIGKQWQWDIEYVNGRKMVNEMVVPRGRPVKLLMGSADVLHSFFIPAFRLKQDIIPGAYTSLWFEATMEGEFHVFCAEYCGTAHSKMLATLKVVSPKEYDRWQTRWELEQRLGITPTDDAPVEGAEAAEGAEGAEGVEIEQVPTLSMVARGKKVFAKHGCTACHSAEGKQVIGPAINGIFGAERELDDGTKVIADENYLRESMMDPQAKMVKGFQPLMPTSRGTVTDEEINAMIAYIKSLAN